MAQSPPHAPVVSGSEQLTSDYPSRCAVLPSVGGGAIRVELSALLAHEISASSLRLATAWSSSPGFGRLRRGAECPLEVVEQRHDFWRLPRAVAAATDEDRL